jgi:hypothetical protein
MASNEQSSPQHLCDVHFATLHRDVLVYDALDDLLSLLTLPSQGLRKLCHDEVNSDHQAHMLSAVARLVTASGLQDAFDIVVANVALARRDWSLITELGIHGVSYEEHPAHISPQGTTMNRLSPSPYVEGAVWGFDNGKVIPWIHGRGRIEQLLRHLTVSLIAITATRFSGTEDER